MIISLVCILSIFIGITLSLDEPYCTVEQSKTGDKPFIFAHLNAVSDKLFEMNISYITFDLNVFTKFECVIIYILYVLLLSFSGLMIRKLYDLFQRKKNNYPPGTNGLPLIGVLIPCIRNPTKYLESLQKYGDVVMVQLGLRNCIIVNNSKLMSKWLASKNLGIFKPRYGKLWNKSASNHDSVYGFSGLFSTSSKIMFRLRRQVSSVLVTLMNTSFLENQAGPYLHSVIFKNIDKCVEDSCLWHPHQDIRQLMFNSVHIGCFGKPLDPQSNYYKSAFKYIDTVMNNLPQFVLHADYFMGSGRLSSFLTDKILHKEFVNSAIGLRKLGAEWCKKYRKELMNNDNKEKLVAFEYLKQYEDGNITEAELYELMSTPFVIGIDSVCKIIERVLIYAAMYPKQQEKVYEELKNIYPSKKIIIGQGMSSKLHYLRALTKETLRVFDGNPVTSRLVTKDTLVESSNNNTMILPKNSIIVCNLNSMNMNNTQQNWHSNTAMKNFDINRWIDSNNNNKFDTSLKIHTFGSGKRGCPGRSLAEREICYFIAEILRNYKVSLPTNANINMKTIFCQTYQISPLVVERRLE